MKLQSLMAAAVLLLCFLLSLSHLEKDRRMEGKQQLEKALHRTAVSCYAAEGIYPPSVEYMISRYGLQYDKEAYIVHYQVVASNLMPDITVLERGS